MRKNWVHSKASIILSTFNQNGAVFYIKELCKFKARKIALVTNQKAGLGQGKNILLLNLPWIDR